MKTKERGYLLIIVFSISICLVLIFSMVTGNKIPGGSLPVHQPPKQSASPNAENKGGAAQEPIKDQQGVLITDQYLEEKIAEYLPEGFPLEQFSVEIGADGSIELSGTADRDRILQYLSGEDHHLSLRQSFFLKLLPQELNLDTSLKSEIGSDGGLLSVVPQKIVVNDSELNVDNFPKEVFDGINQAVNQLLVGTGCYFTNIVFVDGGIRLVP